MAALAQVTGLTLHRRSAAIESGRVPVFLSKSSLTKEHEQPTCHLISQTAHKNSYSGKKYY